MKIPIRKAFDKHLQRRYSLRLHMSAILGTVLIGGFYLIDLERRFL